MSRQHLNAQAVFCCWKEKAQKDGIICGMRKPLTMDMTGAGGGKDMFLAGCYHILHQLGLGFTFWESVAVLVSTRAGIGR